MIVFSVSLRLPLLAPSRRPSVATRRSTISHKPRARFYRTLNKSTRCGMIWTK